MAATKINLTKLACTTNANAVRDRSYEKIFTRKFIIQKFPYTKISRSTVYYVYMWEIYTLPSIKAVVTSGNGCITNLKQDPKKFDIRWGQD